MLRDLLQTFWFNLQARWREAWAQRPLSRSDALYALLSRGTLPPL